MNNCFSGLVLHYNSTHGLSLLSTKMPQQVCIHILFLFLITKFETELLVKTVKYFKSIERVQEDIEQRYNKNKEQACGSME